MFFSSFLDRKEARGDGRKAAAAACFGAVQKSVV